MVDSSEVLPVDSPSPISMCPSAFGIPRWLSYQERRERSSQIGPLKCLAWPDHPLFHYPGSPCDLGSTDLRSIISFASLNLLSACIQSHGEFHVGSYKSVDYSAIRAEKDFLIFSLF